MRTYFALVSALLLVTPASVQSQSLSSRFAGIWHLNIAKSKLHAPAPTEETNTIQNSSPDTLVIRFSLTGNDGTGKPISLSFDGRVDGKPYPYMSNGQEVAKASWSRTGSRQLTANAAYPDGSTAVVSVTLAKDGKSYSVERHYKGKAGEYDETQLWNKA